MPVVPFNKQFVYPYTYLLPFLSNCTNKSLNQSPLPNNPRSGSVPMPACRRCGALAGRGRFEGSRKSAPTRGDFGRSPPPFRRKITWQGPSANCCPTSLYCCLGPAERRLVFCPFKVCGPEKEHIHGELLGPP